MDDSTCLHNCTISDFATRQQNRTLANPHIVTNQHTLNNIFAPKWQRLAMIIINMRINKSITQSPQMKNDRTKAGR